MSADTCHTRAIFCIVFGSKIGIGGSSGIYALKCTKPALTSDFDLAKLGRDDRAVLT